MRTIDRTTRFKREKKGRLGSKLDELLAELIDLLRTDTPLPRRFRDHPLSGTWDDCRDFATFALTWYSSIASRTRIPCSLSDSARMANSAFDTRPEARLRLAKSGLLEILTWSAYMVGHHA